MKVIKIFFVLIIFAIVGGLVAGYVVDELISKNIESALNDITVPANTTVDSSISKTGKITNQDGGLQFYGAILLQSNEKLGTLRSYYKSHAPQGIDLEVINLADSKKIFGENMPSELRFGYHDKAPENYYIVYAWGEAQLPYTMLDFRSYT